LKTFQETAFFDPTQDGRFFTICLYLSG
jgi:hypothetical protein